MKVYSFETIGADGNQYSVRLMLTPDELRGLQGALIVPLTVSEVIGVQNVADGLMATLERDLLVAQGAAVVQ